VAGIASTVANLTRGPGRNLSLDGLIGCCLGWLLGATDSYSWGFGRSVRKEVALRAEVAAAAVTIMVGVELGWDTGSCWSFGGVS
jgi:hypothetical protein